MLALALAARPLLVAYVPNWIDLTTFAQGIDYAKVTHLNVAFENPIDDDGDLSFNPADDALVTKAHAAGVRVFVSLGGGGAAGDKEAIKRFFLLLSPTRRAGFVAKLVEFVTAHGFDGLDVDLEGPTINGDYGPFVRDLARGLRAKGKGLSAALSKGYGGDQVPKEALDAFDWVNVMAYDATGPWNPNQPGPHSSLGFAKDNVRYWLARGLPRSKTVLGVPFYGQGFGADLRQGGWPYREILAAHPGAEATDRAGSTVWYNGVPTVQAKAAYIRKERLAGAMVWSLDGDAPGEQSLLTTLDRALRRP